MVTVTFGIEFEGFFIFNSGHISTVHNDSGVPRPFARLRGWRRQDDYSAGFEISTPVYHSLDEAYRNINRNFSWWLRNNSGVAPYFMNVRGRSLGQHIHFGIDGIDLEYDILGIYGRDGVYHVKNILASHILRFYPLFISLNANPTPSFRMRATQYAIPLYDYPFHRSGWCISRDHYAEISDSHNCTIECRIFDANIPQVALTNIFLITKLLERAYESHHENGRNALYSINWNSYRRDRRNAIERALLGIDTYNYLLRYMEYVGNIKLPNINSIKEILYLACKYRINAYQLFHRLFRDDSRAHYHYFRRMVCNSHKYFDILLEDTFDDYISDEYREKIERWKEEAHSLTYVSELLELARQSQLVVLERIREISRARRVTRPLVRQAILDSHYVIARIYELSNYNRDEVAEQIAYLVNTHGDGYTNPIDASYVVNANERFYVFAVQLPNNERPIIAGAIAIRIRTGEIMHLVVDRRYRGLGIARLLLQHVLNVARRNGLNVVYAWIRTDNEISRRLFESFGFRELSRNHRSICYKLELGG